MLRRAESDSEQMRNWETLRAKYERFCQAPIWAKWETLHQKQAEWERLYTQDGPWLRIGQLPIGVGAGLGDIERDPERRWHALPYDPIRLPSEPPPGATLSALLSVVTGIPRLPEPSSRRAVPATPPGQTGAKVPPLHDTVRLRLNAGHFRTHLRRVLAELSLRRLRERRIDPPPGPAASARLEPLYAREASAVGENTSSPQLSRATKVDVHDAITAVYAAPIGKKPPNLKEVVPLVKAELRAKNQTASWKIVQQCAKDPRHAGKRWSQGATRKSKQIRPADE
jgi:hypothetical protein